MCNAIEKKPNLYEQITKSEQNLLSILTAHASIYTYEYDTLTTNLPAKEDVEAPSQACEDSSILAWKQTHLITKYV